jgi:hypothetical protein
MLMPILRGCVAMRMNRTLSLSSLVLVLYSLFTVALLFGPANSKPRSLSAPLPPSMWPLAWQCMSSSQCMSFYKNLPTSSPSHPLAAALSAPLSLRTTKDASPLLRYPRLAPQQIPCSQVTLLPVPPWGKQGHCGGLHCYQ